MLRKYNAKDVKVSWVGVDHTDTCKNNIKFKEPDYILITFNELQELIKTKDLKPDSWMGMDVILYKTEGKEVIAKEIIPREGEDPRYLKKIKPNIHYIKCDCPTKEIELVPCEDSFLTITKKRLNIK